MNHQPINFQDDFFNSFNPNNCLALLDYIPNIYFFSKDKEGRFTKMNLALLKKFGLDNEKQIIGKTDRDLIPEYLCELYAKDDKQVMDSQKPIKNKIELVADKDSMVDWYLTHKVPLINDKNESVGIAGISLYYKKAITQEQPNPEMAKVIQYIKENYSQKINISDLAQLMHLSLSAFERKFKKTFNMTPVKYIITVRISQACQSLLNTSSAISKIALDTGFSDQSHLCREFVKIIGISPREYRKNH